MINIKEAKVKKIKKVTEGKIEVILDDKSLAIGFPQFTPEIKENDRVLVNTTAVDLELGSGGCHFIIYNMDQKENSQPKDGHIMKLRYTPLQFSTMAVESPESKHHDILTDKISIKNLPVIIGGLHSQLSPAAATLKYLDSEKKIAYIMTDGASLPIGLSDTVADLKKKKLIDSTITSGQAFGGDFEAVNIYSALICAKYVAKADVVVVSMGPGVTGTSTLMGTTAVEVGQLVNAVNSLLGKSIVIPRLSFKDKRFRHQGISHHVITALTKIALGEAIVTLPKIDNKKSRNFVDTQIQMSGLDKKHDISYIENGVTKKALDRFELKPTTMGRTFSEEEEFFEACGCAAIKALSLVES